MTPPGGDERPIQGQDEVGIQPFSIALIEVWSISSQPCPCPVIEEYDLGSTVIVTEATEVRQGLHQLGADGTRLEAVTRVGSDEAGHQSPPRRRMSATRHWLSLGRSTSMSRQALRLVLVTLKVNSEGLTFSPSKTSSSSTTSA